MDTVHVYSDTNSKYYHTRTNTHTETQGSMCACCPCLYPQKVHMDVQTETAYEKEHFVHLSMFACTRYHKTVHIKLQIKQTKTVLLFIYPPEYVPVYPWI